MECSHVIDDINAHRSRLISELDTNLLGQIRRLGGGDDEKDGDGPDDQGSSKRARTDPANQTTSPATTPGGNAEESKM